MSISKKKKEEKYQAVTQAKCEKWTPPRKGILAGLYSEKEFLNSYKEYMRDKDEFVNAQTRVTPQSRSQSSSAHDRQEEKSTSRAHEVNGMSTWVENESNLRESLRMLTLTQTDTIPMVTHNDTVDHR